MNKLNYNDLTQETMAAFHAAVAKHPEFCDRLTYFSASMVKERRADTQAANDILAVSGIITAHDILDEEVLEMIDAAKDRDYRHFVEELAQVVAVLFRIHDMVAEELGVENA